MSLRCVTICFSSFDKKRYMMLESRSDAQTLNPLVGRSTADTLENLCKCLDKLGVSIASHHEDDSIYFFCRSVAAALKYEACQLRTQAKASALRTAHPVRLATNS